MRPKGRAAFGSCDRLQLIAADDQLRPFRGADRSVFLDAEGALKGDDRRLGARSEDAVDGDVGNGAVALRHDVEITLDDPHALSPVALHDEASGIGLADGGPVARRQVAHGGSVRLLDLVEHVRIHDARDGQAVVVLEGEHRVSGQLAEIARDRNRRQLGIEVAEKGKVVLQRLHVHAAHPDTQLARIALFHLGERQSLARDFAQALDARKHLLDFVPRRLADHAVGLEVENLLKHAHGFFGFCVVDARVAVDGRDGGIVLRNAVELPLDGQHVVAERAAPQGDSRIGLGVAADVGVIDDADVVAVVVAQNLHRREALIGERHRAPLQQAVAHRLIAVAELRVERLDAARADNVVVENLVRDAADVVVDLAAVDKILVDGGVVGDVKIVAAAAVVLGVDAVERKGDLREDIGADGAFRPGGIDFVGGDVLDIIGERHRDVRCRRVRSAQMHGDRLGNHGSHSHTQPSLSPLSGSNATGRIVSVLSCTVTGKSTTSAKAG